ncbi:L-threonylcarbamoyladenylate synthase [Thermophagus xiamenensis]|uniref:L-threonylcarbamoyladenylate synthase n=1 Tax=Thermophagus xiamenensis TaxID=385682 RepID=A0A1I1ZJ23_9BACT|nr:L-threonylcarbamoyladenylate synthase [Thermophagus xiamenensis]SFE31716.1 L-threonylcarbamoyladenylate synthase [Thermophagus xiamenensis]
MNFLEDINKSIEVLQNGGIILYPTDTIWGIGCDATNAEAVSKIYNLKKRDDHKSMLVLIDNAVRLNFYVQEVPELAYDLIELSDKPLTIIYPQGKNLAKNLLAEDGSIGIRVTEESFSKTLCRKFRKPLVSTSANLSGNPSPKNFREISKEILNGVDYVVKYRQDEQINSAPSGIIKLGVDGQVKIIRE